jgi:hypothetical protein
MGERAFPHVNNNRSGDVTWAFSADRPHVWQYTRDGGCCNFPSIVVRHKTEQSHMNECGCSEFTL